MLRDTAQRTLAQLGHGEVVFARGLDAPRAPVLPHVRGVDGVRRRDMFDLMHEILYQNRDKLSLYIYINLKMQ